jgi:hypothetical protein
MRERAGRFPIVRIKRFFYVIQHMLRPPVSAQSLREKCVFCKLSVVRSFGR